MKSAPLSALLARRGIIPRDVLDFVPDQGSCVFGGCLTGHGFRIERWSTQDRTTHYVYDGHRCEVYDNVADAITRVGDWFEEKSNGL